VGYGAGDARRQPNVLLANVLLPNSYNQDGFDAQG
jgi:hypothetical protein